MDDTWKLTVWGVRGSFPSPGPAFLGYGGDTACLSVELGGTLVVLDAGSGLAGLGADMIRRGIHRADVLLSHIHRAQV